MPEDAREEKVKEAVPTPRRPHKPLPTKEISPELLDTLRQMSPISWRVYYLSHMIVKPVQIKVTEPYGISWVEWRILITLAHAPGITANEITSAWAFDKMLVSRAVRRLLELKMIRREVGASDSRKFLLFLDKKGQKIFDTLWPGAQDHYADIISTLEPGEFETFCGIADKLITRATEIARMEEENRPVAGWLPASPHED